MKFMLAQPLAAVFWARPVARISGTGRMFVKNTQNHTVLATVALLFAIVSVVSTTACRHRNTPRQTTWRGHTMGTTYALKVITKGSPLDKRAVGADVEKSLIEINKRMSTYDPDSELSRWNASPSTDWFDVAPDTAAVVAEAIRIGRLTHGAFDVTVEPLVRLWHFGPAGDSEEIEKMPSSCRKREGEAPAEPRMTTKHRLSRSFALPIGCQGGNFPTIPSPAEIEDTLRSVSYFRLEVRSEPPSVRKGLAEMRVDLSGIAKGHAIDRLARLLESRGFRNYMIEIGGEVRAAGHNLDGVAWRIAVETPRAGARKIDFVISLDNRAMATSGDYRNYFEQDGVRYSHLLDPRTGSPIRHRLASVTVLSARCAEADALATALMVLGSDAGYKLAESQGIAAAFIVKTDDGFKQKRTSHWPGVEDRGQN